MSSSPQRVSPERRRSSLVRFLDPNHADGEESSNIQTTYGTVSGMEDIMAAFDGTASGDLGGILEEEEMRISLNGTCKAADASISDEEYDDDDDESDTETSYSEESAAFSSKSFHLGESTRMSVRNIMVQERRTSSFLEYGDEYELVPTQLKNNVRLVEDMNMYDGSRGRLYLAQYSFFNNCHETKYALTMHPGIYQQIMSEVNDAYSVPCGLFFCCHGGDGAHTGVSHNDYVDIKLAWAIFAFIIGCMIVIELAETA
jgi:hypothetical protein